MGMDYSRAGEWIVAERGFDPEHLGKCESIMCQGNGYLCVRNATDEFNPREQRDLFVAGTFNKFDDNEVTELPNAADVTRLEIKLDGARFSLLTGTVEDYDRSLNLKTGETVRRVVWKAPNGRRYELVFSRFVSMERLHVIGQKLSVRPLDGDAQLDISGGINGQMTNSGSQHFSEGDKRLFEGRHMQYTQTTGQSKIDFIFNTTFSFAMDGEKREEPGFIVIDRRIIKQEYRIDIPAGSTLTVEKLSSVYTSRDRDSEGLSLDELHGKALAGHEAACELGYGALLSESAAAWARKVWDNIPVTIEAENEFDQLAMRFAQYHLHIMTPAHDNRMNIGAKGLSGEGYKGHTFWDTEMFILPYFIYSAPEIARSLEEYRYLSLPGAHKKAGGNGYEGAQFPWESAWIDDGEVTPVWGAADIVTGLPTKIWSGFIEQHITADVAYGVWEYYKVTGDQDFMDRCGYELILDTAKFWASRLEEGEDGMLHINDVVGPDEYKEHVDDNAFTNHMAAWNIRKAIEYCELLRAEKPEIYARLDEKLGLAALESVWEDKLARLYLPQPREDLVIPQDRTYLTLKDIDLTKYKRQENVGSIYRDYNQEQITHMQVSKQADILIMFLLLENQFSSEVKKANWNYYEPRTLHDSSLSLSTHCILANDMGNRDMAYELFCKAAAIDVGPNMKTSDAGIHAASLAGVWQSVVFGFGGVRMLDGRLRLNPALPDSWRSLEFYIHWQGQKLHVRLTHEDAALENLTGTKPVELTIFGAPYTVSDKLSVKF